MNSLKLVRARLISAVLLLSAAASSHGRTWTDVQGRKIEADLVRVEGEKVVVSIKGKEVALETARLSEEDRKFVQESVSNPITPVATSDGMTLCGQPLKIGGTTTVTEPISEATLKYFEDAAVKPKEIKIVVSLPPGFDPSKPQRVMWVCSAINNEEDRKRGNTGLHGRYSETGTAAGWIVVAVDTDQGNPNFSDKKGDRGGEDAVFKDAEAAMTKAWPGFKTWEFACCGFSGGAKATFYCMGGLLAREYKVIGLFLGGCNEDRTEEARALHRFRKSAMKDIQVFVSNGKSDPTSTLVHAEKVQKSLKDEGYGKVELFVYDGAHTISQEEFRKSMDWFVAAGK